MTDVFISYSRKDKEFVQKLFNALKSRGYETWVDWQDIEYAEDWWQKICAGIEASDNLVFVITPDSVRSKVCYDEIDYAAKHNKRIVPVLHEEIIDNDDRQQMHPIISRHNWLPFTDEDIIDKTFTDLLETIHRDPQHIKTHTRLLIHARDWERSNRNNSLLLRGDELRQAEEWLTIGVNKDPTPTDLHAEYIAASRAARARLQGSIFSMVSIALIIAIGLSILSFMLYQNAEVERGRADDNAATAIIAQDESLRQAETAISAQETSEANAKQLDIANATSETRANESYNAFLTYRANQMIVDNPVLALSLAVAANQNEQSSAEDLDTLMMAATASTIRSVFTGFGSPVTAVSYHPNGRFVAGAARSGQFMVWDLVTNKRVINHYGGGQILSIEFSPDGEMIAVGNTRNILVFDFPSGEKSDIYFEIPDGQYNKVFDLEFSSDGQYLAAAIEHNGVIVWDTQTAEIIARFIPDTSPTTISFGANDASLLIGTKANNPNLILWQIASDEIIQTYEGLEGNITSVDFSPDGEWFVAGDDQTQQAQLWHISIQHPYTCLCDYTNEQSGVRNVAFSPDAKHISVLIDNAASPNIWSIEDGVVQYERGLWKERYVEFLNDPVVNVFSPDGTHLLAGGPEMIYVFDLFSAPLLEQFDLLKDGRITERQLKDLAIEFIATNQNLVPVSFTTNSIFVDTESAEAFVLDIPPSQTETTIHNIRTGELISTIDKTIEGIAIAPDKQTYVYVATTARLYSVDISTGEQLVNFEYGHEEIQGVSNIAFSSDGILLASGTGTGMIFVWDTETGKIIQKLYGHTGAINKLKFSPDNQFLVSASWDHTVIIWDLETGNIHQRLTAHQNNISSIDISPDAQTILSVSPELGIVLWDYETGRGIGRIPPISNQHEILAARFRSDGTIASVDAQGQLSYWQAPIIGEDWLNWVYHNRYVMKLNCDQRAEYNIRPECNAAGVYPMATAYPTGQASPTALTVIVSAQVPLETPILLPTFTPTATLNPDDYATVSGTISYLGKPLSGVKLLIYWRNPVEVIYTDANGYYHIENVPKGGELQISVQPGISEGLARRNWGIPILEGDIIQNFELEAGYRLQGHIVNPDGTPFMPDGDHDWLSLNPLDYQVPLFEWLGTNIDSETGEFDVVLPPAIYRLSTKDLDPSLQFSEREIDLRRGSITNVWIELGKSD